VNKEHLKPVGMRLAATRFLALAALTSGCVAQEVSLATADQTLAQQLSADSQYMRRMFASQKKGVGISGPINLADPAQYRFITDRLTAAGKTPENSPELFTRLQQSKDKAVAQAKPGLISSAATSTDWCAGFIMPGQEIQSGSSIIFNNTRAVVSCLGGSAYVYVDLYTFDLDLAATEGYVVAGTYGEDYSGAIVFDSVSLSPALPATLGRMNYTDSYAISYDAAGLQQYTYFAIETGVVPVPPAPASIALAHPTLHPWIANGGAIEMCELRGSPTQCDYAVGNLTSGVFTGWAANASGVFTGIAGVAVNTGTSTVAWAGDLTSYVPFAAPYDPSHLYLPTIGTLDVGATTSGGCSILSVDSAEFKLVKGTTGGSCSTSASFASSVTFPANSRTASFRTISDFTNDGGTANPPSANCSLSSIVNEAVRPALLMKATANCGGFTMPRLAAQAPGGGPALQQLVFFLNSCFPAGTSIRRADGTRVAVETLKTGDKVISNTKGTVLTVTGTSHGGEDEPLVQLRDNKGHQLQLTAKHPLIKASGEVVFASSIKKNDRVMTDRGIARIVSVARIPYTGQVFNLKLGTPEEQAKVGKDGTTMFAGGFMVGDSTMQREHDTPSRMVAQLPKEWQRDFESSAARKPLMTRALR
jgi:hypothetical protein